MTQPKINFIHKNNCPISMAQRGNWAASIPAECNCENNCSECYFEQGHALTCSFYKEVPFEIPQKENWEDRLSGLFDEEIYFGEIRDFIGSLLASPETHKDCISREKVEKAIERTPSWTTDSNLIRRSDLRRELTEI